MAKESNRTAVIKIGKASHGGRVRGGVNGVKFDFPVDKEITVTEGQLNALNDSGVKFDTVSPLAGEDGAEGSASSSTVTGTAVRLGVEDGTLPGGAEDGEPGEDNELNQRIDENLARESQTASADQAGEPHVDEPAKAPAKPARKPAAKK